MRFEQVTARHLRMLADVMGPLDVVTVETDGRTKIDALSRATKVLLDAVGVK